MRACDIEEYIRDKFKVSVRANQIYYWEEKGLLGKVSRIGKNRRNYTEENIKRIVLILFLTEIALSLRIIKRIIIENDLQAKEIAAKKLVFLKEEIIPALQNYITQ